MRHFVVVGILVIVVAILAYVGMMAVGLMPEQASTQSVPIDRLWDLELATISYGLDIIQEAFADYQTALANGQSAASAYNNLRQVLSRAMRVWTEEFKRTCNQLRIGW